MLCLVSTVLLLARPCFLFFLLGFFVSFLLFQLHVCLSRLLCLALFSLFYHFLRLSLSPLVFLLIFKSPPNFSIFFLYYLLL